MTFIRGLILALFLLGLYLPTSFNYNINDNVMAYYLVGLCITLCIWKLKDYQFPKTIFIIIVLINGILLLSTLLSPFDEYSVGAVLPFWVFSLIFCLNLKDITFGKRIISLFLIVNVLNLILGAFIVMDDELVKDFFLKNYAAYYPNLLPNMFYENKPVLMFSSHSRGAFHLFLFFLISFIGYKHTKKTYYLVFSLGYIFLILNLNSNTGYMYLAFSILILGTYLLVYKTRKLIFSMTIFSVLILFNLEKFSNNLIELWHKIDRTVNSHSNGITGRFSGDGILSSNFEFMKDNFFRPVGITYSDDLFFSDTGIFLYILRGTIVLAILIYVGFYMFLKRNLKYKYQAYLLFISFLLMDIGSPSLTYFRTLFILPFLIVIINSLSEDQEQKRKVKKKRFKIVWSKGS
ncbi:TPA: hypothetical protein ACGXNJ_003413 [Bacillus cereus]|uniref:hypothetical protein n=1 Tax=Bacillus anthracis TaxID=1392 RepID=UPI003731DD26